MFTCLQCLGTGLLSPTELCPICEGSGETLVEKSFTENMDNEETVVPVEAEAASVEVPVEESTTVTPADGVMPNAEEPIASPAEEVAPAVNE